MKIGGFASFLILAFFWLGFSMLFIEWLGEGAFLVGIIPAYLCSFAVKVGLGGA